jgi:hypothetical protein
MISTPAEFLRSETPVEGRYEQADGELRNGFPTTARSGTGLV